MGVGPITDQDGNVHENQLVALNFTNGTLAHSSNGIHWTKSNTIEESDWWAGPVYGNGIWCVINGNKAGNTFGVRRSIDGGKTWSGTLIMIKSHCLAFDNGIFWTIPYNKDVIYTSSDAEIWTPVGSTGLTGDYHILGHDDNKWMCGIHNGHVYHSITGRAWEQLSNSLSLINQKDGLSIGNWYGGCYMNGYFYAIREHEPITIARSPDGKDWKKVIVISSVPYVNITYYKNKLWAFSQDGNKYTAGLFNPDGTIDAEITSN